MQGAVLSLVASIVLGAGTSQEVFFLRGDANSDGRVDISDAVSTLSFLFLAGSTPGCVDAADSNDDGLLDISDPVHTLGFLFLNGEAPPPPQSLCGPDPSVDDLGCASYPGCPECPYGGDLGLQESGSIYRICLPEPEKNNGVLVIWAHGFQDATEPVAIPEDQMRFGDVYLPELINDLGFAFATNSYSKTGLAVQQGVEDILDLVQIFTARHGEPEMILVTGASEGGLITTLLVEGFPEVFAGGIAACGPVGDFERQIRFFGDGRALFDFFFPELIPGDPFHPEEDLVADWESTYEEAVRPVVFAPANASALEQLVVTAGFPIDPAAFEESAEVCVQDMLRYSVINAVDATDTLGGFPFDNISTSYAGSEDDTRLNDSIVRVAADPAAIAEIKTRYDTTGRLQRPLVTIHTTLDSQVPYFHAVRYAEKCIEEGTDGTLHRSIAVDRFGHCNFTTDETLGALFLLISLVGEPSAKDAGLPGGGAAIERVDRESLEELVRRKFPPLGRE